MSSKPQSKMTPSLLYQDGCQPCTVLQTLQEFRKSRELCDVIIQVGSSEIPAHRAVLAASSPYFKAMFTSQLCESTQRHVTMREVDGAALDQLITFIYTATMTVDEENVQALLSCATLLQMTGVSAACCQFLEKQLAPCNCLGIRQFADLHSCNQLRNEANKYLHQHFSEVIQEEEFLLMDYQDLHNLVTSDFLGGGDEETVFQAVTSWLSYDMENRFYAAKSLFSSVRFPLLSTNFLIQQVKENPVVTNSIECYKEVAEQLETKLQVKFSSHADDSFPRRRWSVTEVVVAAGGESDGVTLSSLEFYDPRQDNWSYSLPQARCEGQQCKGLSTPRTGMGLVAQDKYIYIIGGSNCSHPLRTVEVYDYLQNEWDSFPDMTTPRHGMGAAFLGGRLFAVGGRDQTSYLNTVEMFCPQNQVWSAVSSMRSCRCFLGVAELGGMLYAVGGSGSETSGRLNQYLNTTERYDPNLNVWTSICPMNECRSYVSIAALDGCIYAISGYNGLWPSTVERYDPRINRWMYASPVLTKRSNHGVTILNGCIYAIGGFNGVRNVNDVEMYEPRVDRWRRVSPMRTNRYGAGTTTVCIM
ncbi:kelch-like protein 20 isoform X1 [Branchiostoma lanceolatum]|uniref:kelch-like protein 20 isoform X1 n=2 Tax=Branchiostoma lanceolatum TaxID=7740 RepID=UPI0034528CC1